MSAELLMRHFADTWTRLPDLGIAVMPTAGLIAHAERKGWQWTTDEITEGLAAHEPDLAAIGIGSVPAYVLGHDVGPQRERIQGVVTGNVTRDTNGALRWDRAMPNGCAGAPVFIALPQGETQLKLLCVGVVLPGPGANTIATFDQIRPAIRSMASLPPNHQTRRHP